MKKLLSLLLILSFTITISACSSEKNKPENQILKYNLPSEPKSLDPQIADDYSSNIILTNIFEGLTRLDENENVIPGIAKSWEALNNNTEFIFHLRDNTFWGNGSTPVTANDFVFGFRRAVDKNTQAPYVTSLYCIKNAQKINKGQLSLSSLGVTAIDEHTLKIELEYPNENFQKITATPIAMPCNEEFFNSSAGQYGLEAKTVLGNGPFRIKAKYGWDHFNSLHLVKNEGYQGDILPISAGVSFNIGKESEKPIEDIKNGFIDASLIGANDTERAKSEGMGLTSFEDTLWVMTFNFSDPIFSNLNIRKSILTALNRDYVLSRVPNEYTVTNSLVLDGLQINGFEFKNIYGEDLYIKESPDSKNYLNLALKELGFDALPTTSILCLDTPEVKSLASNIIENLNKSLNFNFNMTPVSRKELEAKLRAKSFQIAICPLVLESDNVLEFFNSFTSDNKNNIVGLADSTYDNLIKQAYENSSKSKLEEALSKAEVYLNENVILYPLYKEKKYFASSKNVSGIIFHRYKKGIDFSRAKKIKS